MLGDQSNICHCNRAYLNKPFIKLLSSWILVEMEFNIIGKEFSFDVWLICWFAARFRSNKIPSSSADSKSNELNRRVFDTVTYDGDGLKHPVSVQYVLRFLNETLIPIEFLIVPVRAKCWSSCRWISFWRVEFLWKQTIHEQQSSEFISFTSWGVCNNFWVSIMARNESFSSRSCLFTSL